MGKPKQQTGGESEDMKNEILLLRSVRTGKSTLGGLLAQQLGVPQVSLDEIRWRYYEEIGYDAALARTLRQQGGFLALMLYWRLFDAYSVERVLAEHPNCVIDFGPASASTKATSSSPACSRPWQRIAMSS
jgi:hypothetical protein